LAKKRKQPFWKDKAGKGEFSLSYTLGIHFIAVFSSVVACIEQYSSPSRSYGGQEKTPR